MTKAMDIEDMNEERFRKEVLENPEPAVVEFGAEWCGACHILNPILRQLIADFSQKIRIFKVDSDRDAPLAEKYGIRELPTLLFFKNGEVVDHVIGAVPKKDLADKLIRILN